MDPAVSSLERRLDDVQLTTTATKHATPSSPAADNATAQQPSAVADNIKVASSAAELLAGDVAGTEDGEKWGLPLNELYRLGLKFFKGTNDAYIY